MQSQRQAHIEQGHTGELRQDLNQCFNEEELRTLCSDLGVEYDSLPGVGKEAKARELIAYLDRRGRIPELIEECIRVRSHVDWEKAIYVTTSEQLPTQEQEIERRLPVRCTVTVAQPPPPPSPSTTEPTGVGGIWSGLSSLPALVWIGIVLLVLVLAGFAIYQWVRSPDEQTPPPRLTVSEPSGPTLAAGALASPTLTLTTTLTPTITVASTPTLTLTNTLIPTATFTPMLTLTFTLTPTDTLVPTSPVILPSTPSLTCTPIRGVVEPDMCVAGVSVQVNEGAPRPVDYDEHITLTAGDILRLVNLRYCTSHEAPADRVAGEAYLFPNGVETYEYGLFTRGGPFIYAGCGDVGDFRRSWAMDPGQHRVVIALMHYFSQTVTITDSLTGKCQETGACEVDERFYINLDVK